MVLSARVLASIAAAALVAGIAPAPAYAGAKAVKAALPAPDMDLTLEERSELLKAGQYVWDEVSTVSAGGPVSVVVSLPLQRMHVYRGGELIAASTVSTGKEGKETPVGEYPILQKRVMHHSNLYDSAPMPFMQRLTWDGIALHAGANPGYPASHGCIRLPKQFAQKLFGATSLGAVVYVTDMADLSVPASGTLPYYQPEAEPYTTEESSVIGTTAAR